MLVHHRRTVAGAEYHGGDRRALGRAAAVEARSLVTLSTVAGLLVLPLAVIVVVVNPGPTINLWPVALAFWCTVVLGSGVALLGTWRLGGWVGSGERGAALVALALMVSLVPRIADLLAPVERLRDIRPLSTTVVIVMAGAQIVRSLRRDDVDTAVRPLQQLVCLVSLMVLGVLASATVLLLMGDEIRDAVEWGPAAACLLGAAVVLWVGRRHGNGAVASVVVARTLAVVLLLMGTASFLHHASLADGAQAVAAAAMCTSACLVAALARDRLRAALRVQQGRSLQTLATLGRYSTEVSRERERRHDALNAVAAIRSATEVLTSHGPDLDAPTRAELAVAARAELARVERMLSSVEATAGRAARHDVALTTVLRPVLLPRVASGMVVTAELGDVRVRAVPDVVARIVENLLQNVERHAPGASVRVAAEVQEGSACLTVTDTGPGIPAQRRDELFLPDVPRRDDAHGLGLVSARRLAREQGGDLRLATSETGCRFVLTLPAARPAGARDVVSVTPSRVGDR